ncbi:MAG: hypothetical protein ACOVO3_05805 [Fluviicola sp.]|jgi:hypothetical protein
MERIRLFYFSIIALIVCFHANNGCTHALTEQDAFLIGEATAKGVSVSHRISQWYQLLLLFGVVAFTLHLISRKIKWNFSSSEQKLLLIGFLAGIFAFIQPEFIEITHWTTLLVTVNVILEKWSKAKMSETDLLQISAIFVGHYQLFHSALLGGSIAFLTIWISKQKFVSVPKGIIPFVAAVPLICCLAIEGSFIAASNHLNVSYLWILAILMILLLIYLRKIQLDDWSILVKRTIPYTLAGIALMHVYHPVIDQPLDLFEYANKVNPVMRWQFGELPFTDHISSHLISDYFWSFLYTILHGYKASAAMLIYDSFTFILGMMATYYLLRQLFPNSNTLLWIMMLSPGFFFLLPPYYALVFWPIALFVRMFQDPTRKKTFWFFLSICILFVWRLDIGVSLVIASIVGIILTAIKHPKWIRMAILKMLIIGLPLVLIVSFFAYRYPENVEQIIGYFGANQAHGFSVMTLNESNLYWIDYFILPLVVVAILVFNLISNWKNWDRLQAYVFIAGVFYLFNLQRGMVRHSFVEGYDTQILSLGWSILIAQCIWWLRHRNEPKSSHLLIACSFIAPFIFSIAPGKQHQSIFQLDAGFSLKDISISGMNGISRVKPSPEFDQNVKPLIAFLRDNLGKQESFLDFSNSPMLYFYAERKVPSYFNQYLQNTVSNKLQGINLKFLNRKKPKYVVFSQVPEGYFDNSDGIPNKVRYHMITAFIYKNYQPMDTIGKFRIWELKGHKPISASSPSEQWNLGQIPYFWKPEKTEKWEIHASRVKFLSNEIQWSSSLKPGSFLRMRISSAVDQVITVHKTGFSLSFDLKSGTHTYHFPLGMSENCVYSKEPILLNAVQPITIKTIQIVSLEPK